MCKTKTWELCRSSAEGLLQPGKNKQTKTKQKPDKTQTDSIECQTIHIIHVLSSPGAGHLNAVDMWIKQYDTSGTEICPQFRLFLSSTSTSLSQPPVANLFGSPCQKSPELHRID